MVMGNLPQKVVMSISGIGLRVNWMGSAVFHMIIKIKSIMEK